MKDVLELMLPSTTEITIYETRAAAESLAFLDWFRFDGLCLKCLTAFAEGKIVDCLELMGTATELATGLPASDIDAGEALVAFVVLGKLNELRYIDPDFVEASVQTETEEEGLENFVLVELMTTLALRFTVDEITNMTPEFAILCWQKIREEIATDRDVVFYSTEMGFDKKWTSKKAGKYMLTPRTSPYAPVWLRKRAKRIRQVEIEQQKGHVPRLVFGDVSGVVDGKTGKTLKELGELSVQTDGGEND